MLLRFEVIVTNDYLEQAPLDSRHSPYSSRKTCVQGISKGLQLNWEALLTC